MFGKKIKLFFFTLKIIIRYPLDFLKGNKISIFTRISSNTKISNTTIGAYCYIANNTNIVNTIINNYCSIAPGVQIGGMEHSFWWHSTSTFLSDDCISNKKTIIESDVWIGAGAIIKQGVVIGKGSIVGAMSFVNKDVPPNTIVVGVPSRILKKRMDEDVFDRIIKSEYWKLTPLKAKRILNQI